MRFSNVLFIIRTFDSDFIELNCYNNLFNSIHWEDEEPIRIDDYAEREENVR